MLTLARNWLSLIWAILRDEVGKEPPADDDKGGQGDPPPKEGEEGAPPAGEGEGEGGEGEEPPAPKYGDLGDNPTVDQVYETFTKTQQELDNLKGKTTATEKSLAALRKGMKDAGIKILADPEDPDNVQFELEEPEEPAGPKKRFTDTHKALLEEDVWDAIKNYVLDLQDEGFTAWEKQGREKMAFASAHRNSNVRMFKLFPSLREFDADGKKLDTFNEAFYDRATEIAKERYGLNPSKRTISHPEGELFAAHEAAIEMSISPASVAEAAKVAAAKAKAGKKVLGPAGKPSAQRPGAGAGRKFSREEYLALSEEDRDKYDKGQLKIE